MDKPQRDKADFPTLLEGEQQAPIRTVPALLAPVTPPATQREGYTKNPDRPHSHSHRNPAPAQGPRKCPQRARKNKQMPEGWQPAQAYSKEEHLPIIRDICDDLLQGMSLSAACKKPGRPDYKTIINWLTAESDLRREYDSILAARAVQAFEASWEVLGELRAKDLVDNAEVKRADVLCRHYNHISATLDMERFNPQYKREHEARKKQAPANSLVIQIGIFGDKPDPRMIDVTHSTDCDTHDTSE